MPWIGKLVGSTQPSRHRHHQDNVAGAMTPESPQKNVTKFEIGSHLKTNPPMHAVKKKQSSWQWIEILFVWDIFL